MAQVRLDLLHVPLARDDAGQLTLELEDVGAGALHDGRERRLVGVRWRRGADNYGNGRRAGPRVHFLTVPIFSSTFT